MSNVNNVKGSTAAGGSGAADFPSTTATTDPSVPAGSKYAGMYIPKSSVVPGMTANVTAAQVLSPNYTKSVRDVTLADKIAILKRDGLISQNATETSPEAKAMLAKVEIDHLRALISGGANSTKDVSQSDYGKNLWAQPIDQARIKDVTEVHGRMYLQAMLDAGQGDQGLKNLGAFGSNWIQLAMKTIDPWLASKSPAQKANMLLIAAKSLEAGKAFGLAAAAYRELSHIHTKPEARSAENTRLFMEDTDVSDRFNAETLSAQYAKKADELDKKGKGKD